MKLFLASVLLSVIGSATLANGQTTIQIANAMQTRATVRIVQSGGTAPTTFVVNNGNAVNFTFTADIFDIQVIPDDNPNSGFRFLNVNLKDVAAKSNGRVLRLDGDFAPSKNVLVCRRRGLLRRCVCCCQSVRGERIAVGLIADLNDGTEFKLVSPKMTYAEVMGN